MRNVRPCSWALLWEDSPRCRSVNTHGTKTRVVTVATISPPITARPSGALVVLDSDIGIMPTTIAMAVISTGLMRS